MKNFVTAKALRARPLADLASSHGWRAIYDAEELAKVAAEWGKVARKLCEVNGKATTHTVDISGLVNLAREVEQRLAVAGIPKSARAGVLVVFTPAGPSAGAHKWQSVTTTVQIQRGASGWRFVGAERDILRPRSPERMSIFLTPSQADCVRAASMAGFEVAACQN